MNWHSRRICAIQFASLGTCELTLGIVWPRRWRAASASSSKARRRAIGEPSPAAGVGRVPPRRAARGQALNEPGLVSRTDIESADLDEKEKALRAKPLRDCAIIADPTGAEGRSNVGCSRSSNSGTRPTAEVRTTRLMAESSHPNAKDASVELSVASHTP